VGLSFAGNLGTHQVQHHSLPFFQLPRVQHAHISQFTIDSCRKLVTLAIRRCKALRERKRKPAYGTLIGIKIADKRPVSL
jgi:hypothetical protein